MSARSCHPGAVSTPSSDGRVLARHAERLLRDALEDTRVVTLNGARQAGKSTLAKLVGADVGAVWRSLDDDVVLRAALDDPRTFVASSRPLVIDEIQRAPELVLAVKAEVDRDPRPGRFLLTGSARVLGLRSLPDSLVGRNETIELWPFSQGEIDGSPDAFVDAVFTSGPGVECTSDQTRADYAHRIVRGGFPEAVARTNPRRRRRFLDAYVDDLVTRDVSQLSEIERVDEMRRLLQLVAARSSQLLVENHLAGGLGISQKTVGRYLDLLEEVFLVKRIPPWSRNLSSRAVGTPKVAFVDSGVAAAVLDVDPEALLRPDGVFGRLLESFVLMELARQLSWSDRPARLYHYRTRDGVEVDAVLESRRGEVVAVDVKAAATVRSDDFRGLRHLESRLGDDFLAGFVMYTGPDTLPFGPRMRAVPVSALWETAPT
jgi:hypothetical protein